MDPCLPFSTEEHTSVRLHTHTECTPTTVMDTTSMCHKLCLPTLASLSRGQHGQSQRQMADFSPSLMSANQTCHIFYCHSAVSTLCAAEQGEVSMQWWPISCHVFINRELGIETVAPYPPSGHLHSHLPHYHPPPRLHHFPIPFMVRVKPSAHMHTLA